MKNKFKPTISTQDIVWLTLPNSTNTRDLAQHAFRDRQEDEVGILGQLEGNISLCNRFSAWEGEKPNRISDFKSENQSKDCCKVCLKVFNTKLTP